MTAHTPGPWWLGVACFPDEGQKPVGYRGAGNWNHAAIYGADKSQVVGCDEYDVFGDVLGGDERRAADIRLILAAPDMLAALKAFMDAHELATSEDGRDSMLAGMVVGCALEVARQAIAKATGGSA